MEEIIITNCNNCVWYDYENDFCSQADSKISVETSYECIPENCPMKNNEWLIKFK